MSRFKSRSGHPLLENKQDESVARYGAVQDPALAEKCCRGSRVWGMAWAEGGEEGVGLGNGVKSLA